MRDLGVSRAFLQLLDPFVDRLLLALDRRFDSALARVLNPTLQPETAGDAGGEEAIADPLNLAVD